MLDFTDPMKSGFLTVRPSPNILCNAEASIGSPTFVPLQEVSISKDVYQDERECGREPGDN
jgi:hypothetical protein